MKTSSGRARAEGFALIIVVTLLSLLVLAVYALAVVVKVGGQVAGANGDRVQARQNALLGLSVGLGELQRHAGDDSCITGSAGITGVDPGGSRTTRNWCGIWRSDGGFVRWTTSGASAAAEPALAPGVVAVKLAAEGSVGASFAHSEHVIAGKVPIAVSETAARAGVETVTGAYAYTVFDEGTKISAYTPAGTGAAVQLVITRASPSSAQGRLRAALEQHSLRLRELVSFEQLSVLPAPLKPLTPSTLQDNFHHVTLTAAMVDGAELQSGRLNLNTTSPHVWRSLVETYGAAPGAHVIDASEVATIGTGLARDFADCASGKAARGPFTSVGAFAGSALLTQHLPKPVTPEEFVAVLGPLLAVRSDTFRIRGYGEVQNPLKAGAIEASAYCEAIVQRTEQPDENGFGRKFVITFFRWLGPEDI